MRVVDIFRMVQSDLLRHKLRTILAVSGVAWGSYAILILLALGQGYYLYNSASLSAISKPVLNIYLNKTTKPFAGFPMGREISLTLPQLLSIKSAIPGVKAFTPLGGVDAQFLATTGKTGHFNVSGVSPAFFKMMSFAQKGRTINHQDIQNAASVIVLSNLVKVQLFGKVDPIGKTCKRFCGLI